MQLNNILEKNYVDEWNKRMRLLNLKTFLCVDNKGIAEFQK